MKKLTLLIMLLLLSLVPCEVFAKDNALSDEVKLIEYIGIAAGLEERAEESISRAEFLSWSLKLARIEVGKVSEEPLFNDVTAGHSYAAVITAAAERGIISGMGQGSFRPDDAITVSDAAIMLINAMGYKYEASAGEYVIYDKLSRAMGLLDDVTYPMGDTLTGKNAAIMLFNALNSPEIGFESLGVKVDLTEDRTFMEKEWEIYRTKGILDTTPIASLTGREVYENHAYIDDLLYNSESFRVNDLLGLSVEAFYYDIDDEKTLIYAYPTKRNKIVKMNDEEFQGFSDNTFTYLDGSKKDEYKINTKTSVIWNNRILRGNEFEEKLNSKSIEVTFISNDGDNIYEIVIAKDATVYIPVLLDLGNLILGAKDLDDIELNEYNSYSITDIDGKTFDFSDIKRNHTVLVYDPGDRNTHIEIVVIKEAVSLAVEGMDAEEGKLSMSDGGEYIVSANSAYPIESFEMNTTYSIYLDKLGRIVYARVEKRNGFQAMYMMKAYKDAENDMVLIKMLNQDGEIKRYTVAEKINYRDKDGEVAVSTGTDDIYTVIGGDSGSFERRLVYVRLNSKGEINTIYNVSKNKDDTFHDPEPVMHNAYRWMAAAYSFENLIQLKANTKVFFVPQANSKKLDDEYFYVGDLSMFRNDTAYQNIDYYKTSGYGFRPVRIQPGTMESDYIVIECPEGKTFTTSSSSYGIVTKIRKTYSEKLEEICDMITIVNISGVEQEYEYLPEAESLLGIGDIIQVMSGEGTIRDRDINMYYDYDKNKFDWITVYDNDIGWRYYAPFRVTKGTVHELENGIAYCNVMTTKNNAHDEYVRYNQGMILKFDSPTGGYTLMDSGNLKAGDNFYAIMSNGVFKVIIFYGDLKR